MNIAHILGVTTRWRPAYERTRAAIRTIACYTPTLVPRQNLSATCQRTRQRQSGRAVCVQEMRVGVAASLGLSGLILVFETV